MSLPGDHPLALYRGDSFRDQFSFMLSGQPIDLTGVVAAAEIRAAPRSAPLLTFACTITDNVITISLTAAQTRVAPAAAYWDLELTYPSGDVWTPVGGFFSTRGDITGSSAPGTREVAHA